MTLSLSQFRVKRVCSFFCFQLLSSRNACLWKAVNCWSWTPTSTSSAAATTCATRSEVEAEQERLTRGFTPPAPEGPEQSKEEPYFISAERIINTKEINPLKGKQEMPVSFVPVNLWATFDFSDLNPSLKWFKMKFNFIYIAYVSHFCSAFS